MNDNENYSEIERQIDKLLSEGKETEATPLMEKIRKKEAQEAEEIIASVSKRLDALEKRFGTKS